MRSVFCFPRTLDFALGFYVFLIELIHTKAHSHRNTNTDAHSTKVTIDLSRMLHGQVPSCTFSWRSPVKQRSRASRCVLTRCALEKGMDVLVMGTNIKQVSLNYETPPTNHTRKQTMAFHGWNTWVVARSIESGTSRKNKKIIFYARPAMQPKLYFLAQHCKEERQRGKEREGERRTERDNPPDITLNVMVSI